MGRSSIASAFASIGKQLTPKGKFANNGGGSSRRRSRRNRQRDDLDSTSSSGSSFYSDISKSDASSSSYSSSQSSRSRNRRKNKDRRNHHRGDKRSDRRRRQRKERDRSPSESPVEEVDDFYSSPAKNSAALQFSSRRQRHSSIRQDVAKQMTDLLMRLLPFYGQGDQHSNSVVIDTIHRLPPHALEMHDIEGNTMLMLACQVGAYDLLPLFLSKGCNVNARNNVGASCLHFACFADTFSPDAAIALIHNGAMAEVVEQEFGCTPLHWAAWAGHVELCRVLCSAGASPKTMDKNGCDPIAYSKQYAAQTGHTACTQLLESIPGDGSGVIMHGNPGRSPSEKSEWVRLLDGNTGSSFYHNKESGESLWGDDFRRSDHTKECASDNAISSEIDPSNGNEDGLIHSPGNNGDKPYTSPKKEAVLEGKTKHSEDAKHSSPTRYSVIGCLHPLDNIAEDLSVETLSSNEIVSIHSKGGEMSKSKTSHEKYSVRDDDLMNIDFASPDKEKTLKIEGKMKKAQSLRTKKSTTTPHHLTSHDMKNIVDEFSSSSDESMHFTEKTESSRHRNSKEHASAKHALDFESSKANTVPSNRSSFEERISLLHQKMESQLIDRLRNIEEKISQQKTETTPDSGDIAEMASTILRLQTEVATKDLEILSTKQKLVRLENTLETNVAKPEISKVLIDSCVGDGNVNEKYDGMDNDDILTQKAHVECELAEAHDQIVQLQKKVQETIQSCNVAKEQSEQTELLLATAEQTIQEEKASRNELMHLLDQSREGKQVDAALAQSFQEDKHRADETINGLNEQLRELGSKMGEETRALRVKIQHLENKIITEQTHAEKMTKLHEAALDELKCSLNEAHRLELDGVQNLLQEEKLEKMESEIAKHDAVDAMDRALEKARIADSKLLELTDFVKTTEELTKANEKLHLNLQNETEKRKVLHNKIEDMKGRIRVYVRVRPLSSTEVDAKFNDIIIKEDDRTCVMKGDADSGAEVRDWEFDKIFSGSDVDGNTQQAVFSDASDLLTSAIDGFNVCIFAYGQTGSGKTFTMFGSDDPANEKLSGLAPRVAQELFKKLEEREPSNHIEVAVSMMELYNDKLLDLLVSKNNASEEYAQLKIRLAEHTTSGLVEVEGAKIERATNSSELLDVFLRGSKGRTSSSTKMNEESSRSHMITTVVITLRNRRTGNIVRGKLTLVDLAGSERVSKSGAAGHQLKEAQSINKSLSALGDVIGALTTGGRQHIPYRNHPLTMLMSDSIGGNAKTLMFVCCSPADYNRKETTNSLDFAKRCRNVTNNAVADKTKKGGSSAGHVSQVRALKKELSKIQGKPARRPTGLTRRPGM